MPIADPDTYRAMLRNAAERGYALPSVNITSSTTANGVLTGLAAAECDGIVGIGLAGGRFGAGPCGDDPATGARALAEFVHVVADRYPINVALHTDHCPPDRLESFVLPLVEETRKRRAKGRLPLFQSHMFDGSHLDLDENLTRSEELVTSLRELDVILELEIGLVGGEEDEIDNRGVDDAKLYTSPGDMVAVVDRLGSPSESDYLVAASFGNVHGVHPPGDVTLDPDVLRRGQEAIDERFGADSRLLLVFHGGSGSSAADIDAAIGHGVVKMNIDTDTQYAYTRAVAGHFYAEYDRVLAIDGQLADKSAFEQRRWMGLGEAAMAERVVTACEDLHAAGTTLFR